MIFLAETSEAALNLNTTVSISLLVVLAGFAAWLYKMKSTIKDLTKVIERLIERDTTNWSIGNMNIWADKLKKSNKHLNVPSVNEVVEVMRKTPIQKIIILLCVLFLVGCKTATPVHLRQQAVMEMPPLPQSMDLEAPLHIDSFAVDVITNAVGTDAHRFTFTVSGMNTSSNYAMLVSETLTNENWLPLILWTPTSETETYIRTNALHLFFNDLILMRARTF